MKRIALAGIFLGCLLLLWHFFPGKSTEVGRVLADPTPSITLLPTPMIPADAVLFDSIAIDTGQYTIYGREIFRGTPVSLLPNFTQRQSGQQLAQDHHCHTAINGGFYTKEGTPLGWFITEGSQSGQRIDSSLVTGFFWQDTAGKRYISRTAPENNQLDFVLQTGPYIEVRNQRLRLVNDELARRSLLGVDEENKLYVLSVTDKSNTFSGPNLADIPVLFSHPDIQKKIPFRTVLNLDGGTASFFYFAGDNQSFVLSELSPIGSLLCMAR